MESTFVCNMNALSAAQKERYKLLVQKLNENRQTIKELNDGYAFRFKAEAELIKDVAEFIIYERLCCPFFDFELVVEQDSNRLWLRLRGQDGIKEFIRHEFGFERNY